MSSITYTELIIPVLIALFFISIFYYAFKIKWPELYFTKTEQMSIYVSVHFSRYVFFRILPVLFIITFVLNIYKTNYTVIELINLGILIALMHTLTTNGVALAKLIFHIGSVKTNVNKASQQISHIITIIVISAVGALSGYIARWGFLKQLTPTAEGLVDNIWASLITALLAIFLYRAYQDRVVSNEDIFDRSKKSIDPKLFALIEEYSRHSRANIYLVQAVCIIENIQRPAWFRKLEVMMSILVKDGTYGIMQVKSSKPISDEESIKQAIEKYFVNSKDVQSNDEIEKIIKKYNFDPKYFDLVLSAYSYLLPPVDAS